MKSKRERDLSGIWAVTWRSLIYMPAGIAVFFLLLCLVVVVLAPPFVGVECLCWGLWRQGIALFALSFLEIWVWRRFRVHRLFQSPSSIL